jgi:hypothetical protein
MMSVSNITLGERVGEYGGAEIIFIHVCRGLNVGLRSGLGGVRQSSG